MAEDGNEYDVGYGKPPKHSRWEKGQSGNPKGREKGKRGMKADLARAIDGQQTITIGGEQFTGTRQSLTLLVLATRAAAGDLKAANILLPLMIQVLGVEDRGTKKQPLSAADQRILDTLLGRAVPPAADHNESPVSNEADNDKPDTRKADEGDSRCA